MLFFIDEERRSSYLEEPTNTISGKHSSWWRHQTEIFSVLLTLYEGNPPVTGEFPPRRPMTRGFDVFFDLHLNGRANETIVTPVIWDAIVLIMTWLQRMPVWCFKKLWLCFQIFLNMFLSLLYDANVGFNALHLSSETILQVVYIKFACPGLAFWSSQPRPSTVLYDYYLCIRITAVTGGHVSQQGASQVNTGDRKHFMTRVRCVQTTTLPLDRKQSQSDPGQYRPRSANRIPGWSDLIVPRLTLPGLVNRHRWPRPSYWLVDLIVSHFNYSRSGRLKGSYCGFNYGLATMC